MGVIRRKNTLDRIKHFALKKSERVLIRTRYTFLLGPDITRWLNGLLKDSELTPNQRSSLAYSGAWITAPITVAQDILNGVTPQDDSRRKKRAQLFAETVCDIEPSILYRHWPGHPDDLERIRRLLGKVVAKQIPAVVPISNSEN